MDEAISFYFTRIAYCVILQAAIAKIASLIKHSISLFGLILVNVFNSEY